MNRRARALWLASLAFVGLGYAAYLAGFRVNTTNSMPEGLWWVGSSIDPDSLRRGQVVTFCLPEPAATFAQERGYVGSGDCPGNRDVLIKPIAAIPGDMIGVFADGVSVNGVAIAHSAVAVVDSRSRHVPAVPFGVYPVWPGTVWVLSVHDPLAYDSRYFGAVPIANLRGVASPVLATR